MNMTGVFQWVAGGAVALVASIALAYASSSSTTTSNLELRVSSDESTIGQLHTSSCIQNENMRNLAAAIHSTFVSDPNCP